MQAHATLAQYSLEAKILGVLLVLPYSHTTTVDDIAAAAYAEYQLLNPRAPPQKVLCVRDASGRILSGKLNLIKHNVGTFVDVQVEEWFHADVITQPEALDEEYRKWQMWTGRQVHEMILDSLSAQTSSGSISSGSGGVGETESLREEWIALLDELSHSPSEKVQQMCIRSLQVLRQKSRSERQVRYATSKLVSLLQVSDYVSVVTSVLSVFQRNAASLLPLSQYHAEEVLMLTATIDLDALIGRFPEHHEALVRGFSNLYTSSYSVPAADEALEQAAAALSGDLGEEEQQQEVQRLKDGLKPLAPASALERQAGRESRGPLVSSLVGAAMQAAFSAPPDPSLRASNERLLGGAMTTSRVLALMQSDDPSMRRFALDKLHAMLLAKAEVPPPDEAEGGRHSSRVPSLGLNGEEKKPDPTFFPAEADVSALAIALFRALRESLGSRSSSASPSLSPSASPTRHEQYPKLFPASHSKPEQSPINQHQLKQKLKQKQEEEEVPKARRLIHAQLDAEDCDVEMLRTVMSCLIVCCTSQRPAFNSLRGGGPSSSAHMIAVQLRQDRTPSETPEVVSQWLSVFARAGEPWAKLLITLAHIRDEVLAEPFAFLAQAVLDAAVPSTAAVSAVNGRVLRAASTTTQLQQQHYGWDALQVKLDAPAVAMLLECEPTRSSLVEPTGWAPLSIYGRNFRRGLALQWLSYLSASKAPAGREQRGVNNGNKKRRAGAGAGAGAGVLLSAQLGGSKEALPPDGAEELAAAMSGTAPGVQTLLPLLRRRDWDLVLRLWSLATAPNLPSRQHRRQAMVALANISALAEVAHVLERVYALAKWVPSSCFLLPSLSPSY